MLNAEVEKLIVLAQQLPATMLEAINEPLAALTQLMHATNNTLSLADIIAKLFAQLEIK
jgi:hypothetical protein